MRRGALLDLDRDLTGPPLGARTDSTVAGERMGYWEEEKLISEGGEKSLEGRGVW